MGWREVERWGEGGGRREELFLKLRYGRSKTRVGQCQWVLRGGSLCPDPHVVEVSCEGN